MRRFCHAILSLTFLCGFALSCKAASKQEEADALMKQAAALSLFQANDAPPFRLRLHLKLAGMRSGSVEGNYSWASNAHGQWRQELTFADFVQLQGGSADRQWQKRSVDFEPKPSAWVLNLVNNLHRLTIRPDEELEKINREGPLRCLEFRAGSDGRRSVCFDKDGLLTSVMLSDPDTVYEYSNYTSLAEKRFPRSLRVTWNGRHVVDAELQELTSDRDISDDTFVAPPGAIERASCWSPQGGHLLKKVQPLYPITARDQYQTGSVTLYIEITKDGTVRNPQVIQTAGLVLNDAALTAVKQWQFAPYMCGNTPIEMEDEVTVIFSLLL